MAYALGAVKPHVKRAAEVLGPRFGYTVVYGWGIGSVPNSDHPKGLALDFMGSNKARGDALVAYLIANKSAYAVKYIIWRGRIWENGTWRDYSGPSNHYNHIHVSFLADGGTLPVTTDPVALPNPIDAAGQLLNLFQEIDKGFQWITDSRSWVRIGLVLGGGALALIGLLVLIGRTDQAKDTVRATADIIGAAGSKAAKGATNAKS